MPLPADVLRFFAELAPVGRGPRWNHAPAPGDLVTVPWPWQVMQGHSEGELILETGAADMRRLWSAARIAGTPGFLRLGWMFISGSASINGRETKLFLPVSSAQVRVRRPQRAGRSDTYQLVADADLAVPESVFSDHRERIELNEKLDALASEAFPTNGAVIPVDHVRPFVAEFCSRASIPEPAHITGPGGAIGIADGELTLHTGLAVYVARDRSAINLESTLREWATERLEGSALSAVYWGSATEAPPAVHSVASSLPLNRKQEHAVVAARDQTVTVVSGPPGTGKTHTAVAVAIDQVAHGRSVLIATQTDDAIDAVEQLLDRYASPRHVRFGSRSSRKRVAVELSDGLVVESAPSRLATDRLEAMEGALEEIEGSVRRRLEIEAEFTAALAERRRNSWLVADAPGLSEIVTSPHRCAEALALLEAEPTGFLAGIRRARRRRRLAAIFGVDETALERLAAPLQAMLRAEISIRRGQEIAGESIGAAFEELEATAAEVRELFGNYVEAIRSRKSWDAGATRSIGELATALRSGQAARRRALRTIEMRSALAALPLWIGTLADIDDVLPIRPEMFDVVIIDEASQVNQVRAATALARGRRAVVIGDPRQLRHVSFVGDDAMQEAARRSRIQFTPLIDVRRNSLFDVTAAATPVLTLDEHYRSSRHLIDFSNRRFYEGRLQLMTEHPATSSTDVIHFIHVPGERNSNGVVQAEVERVFELLSELEGSGSSSVGVVTPFRAQADALAQEAQNRLSPERIEALDLRISTVHGFQGNERDNVIVSLGVGEEDSRSLRFIEDPNLFNVMVTRAKADMTVLLAIDPDNLPDGLLLDYFRHASRPPEGPLSRAEPQGWTRDVATALEPFGVPVHVEYPVGEYRIDIVVGEGERAVGVECCVHVDGVKAHIERHVALRRAGWELMTAMESRWLARPEDAAEAIARRLIGRG